MLDAYPLIAVVGPTGSGKSALALRLAVLFGGEIVNCDSVQVYAGLDIGSAKTPVGERFGVPHHLLDVMKPESAKGADARRQTAEELVQTSGGAADTATVLRELPQSEMTAGDYARQAGVVLEGIRGRGTLPVIAGGTGFYLRALLDGLSPAPKRNPELRARLAVVAQRRPGALHRFLKKQDAKAAERVHENDHQKLIRAIEMAGMVQEERRGLPGFRVLKIGLNPDRSALYEKLDRRCEWMFENGLLEETRALLKSGVSASAKALGTLGYKQTLAVLNEGRSVADAIAECQLRTRHYAKRQITWFRAEKDLRWLNGFGGDEAVQEDAAELVRSFLG